MTLFRLCVLLFSLYGGKQFFEHKLRLQKEFAWLTTICSIILVLYVAGFMGVLYPAIWLLFMTSTAYGFYYLSEIFFSKKTHFQSIWLWDIWFIVFTLLLVSVLFNTQLEHYDNFSHWALIVKFLFTEGRLPEATDALISYTSYPMGSSLFIYYTTVVAGFQDNVMLIGQFFFITASLYALGAFLRDKTRLTLVAVLIFGVTLFNYFNIAIRLNNLLVDYLLPTLALAGMAAVYAYKREPVQLSFLVFLISAVLSLVKTSGIFFSFFILIYYFYQLLRHLKKGRKWKQIGGGLLTVGLSFVPILYWNTYVKANFPITKHEVSLTTYQAIFDAKDDLVTQDIMAKMLTYLTDISNSNTQGFLLFNVGLLMAYVIIRFRLHKRNPLLKIWVVGNSLFGLYYLGIFLMFLFSMPVEEAVRLAGIERYASSIVIFVLGLGVSAVVVTMDYTLHEQNIALRNYRSYHSLLSKRIYQYSAVLLLFAAILFLLSEVNGIKYHNTLYNQSVPAQLNRITGHRFEADNEAVLVVSSNRENVENYYTGFVAEYYLFTPEAVAREDFNMSLEVFENYLEGFDSLVVLEEHWTFNALLTQLIGKSLEPGQYDMAELLTGT